MSAPAGGGARAARDVRLEPMTEVDLAAAIAIDLEAFTPGELAPGAEDPRVARERSLREELGRAWSRVLVARDANGVVVGYILYWHVVDELHLLNVAVARAARRRGIGRLLMDELLAYGRAKAASRVLLEVRASNEPARAMYDALGFTELNVRRRYYADGEDAVEMELGLSGSHVGAR